MFSLRHLAVVFAALFLLPSVLGAALAPRASGSPQCQYTCPPHDKKGNSLDKQQDAGPYIKCTYGHNPVRNCFYDREDGSPKNGNHQECPKHADKKDHDRQRRASRELYDAYEVQRKRRAAMPVPSIPEYMNMRATLKKRSADTDWYVPQLPTSR